MIQYTTLTNELTVRRFNFANKQTHNWHKEGATKCISEASNSHTCNSKLADNVYWQYTCYIKFPPSSVAKNCYVHHNRNYLLTCTLLTTETEGNLVLPDLQFIIYFHNSSKSSGHQSARGYKPGEQDRIFSAFMANCQLLALQNWSNLMLSAAGMYYHHAVKTSIKCPREHKWLSKMWTLMVITWGHMEKRIFLWLVDQHKFI